MKYKPIDRLNVEDAARRLEEAQRTNDSSKIDIAVDSLKERLTLIKPSNPQLYAEYFHLIKGHEND